ncbi:MAG: bifunctional metallophosphatase/5'-nucleotidase [Prevotella sp.]|jgi:2',3'-cyclic-nucleotide 2'-phosphodiesterase/3'-nucleotidase|nr:bifunctional metallophosphatase/5'-nucleotidase [Prevotella sp.]
MKHLLTTVLTAFCLALSHPVMAQTKTVRLKVVETSDVHGRFFPYDFIERTPLKGTLARVNTYVERQRREWGDRLLLIDNGDILQGQPCVYWSNYVMPEDPNLGASIVNYMRYDAETVGNHDIETGHPVYDKWIREVRCPLLGANIVDKQSRKPYVEPYATFVRDGVKIAVLGMITPTISSWLTEEVYKGMEFTEMVQCAQYWVSYIKKVERPDLIFGLFHSGLDGGITMDSGLEENATQRVAQEVEGFDVIFFGHDHQVHNIRLKNPKGREVLCIDPSCYARNVAEANIELTFRDGKLVKKDIQGQIVDVSDEPVDQRLVAHFQPQIDQITAYVDRRIGSFATEASTRDSYFGPSAFTDFIHHLQLSISGADVSFNAPLSFDSRIPAGPVTVADMFKLYRFENRLFVLRMTGREIRGHLEMSYDLWANTMTSPDDHLLLISPSARGDQQRMGFKNYTFNFDSASGIDYEVDVTKPAGQKVRILRMSNGEPFDEHKTYRVVMNSYRGNGGGELLTRGAGIHKDSITSRIIYQSPLDLRYYLMQEIERRGTVTPTAASNWKFVPEEWTRPAALRDRKLVFGD